MKILSLRAFAMLAGSALFMTACSKKEDPVLQPIDPGGIALPMVKMRFMPTMDGQPLELRTKTYTNAAGEAFVVTVNKYFVSNFSLTTESGTSVALPSSYFLVDADSIRTVSIASVPDGRYTKISFMIGIDSLHNVSGLQEGDLDPAGRAKGMYWDWNAGYIQAKMEGKSAASSLVDSSLFYHIGGFAGQYNPLRMVTLDLPSVMEVAPNKAPLLQIQSELSTWFAGPPAMLFKDKGQVMTPGKESVGIANGYAKGYKVVSVTP